MYWFYFSSLAVVALVVLYLLWYYPNEQTTVFVKLIIGLAWFASLSVLVLVPEDVKNTLHDSEKEDDLYTVNKSILGSFWAAVYWTAICFILLVLPFLQKYSDSGEFTILNRCFSAFLKSGQIFIMGITVLMSGFLVLYFLDDLTFSKFVGWLMAVLNAYGLISAIMLLGYGMVDIPRKLWLKANHPQRQNFLFQKAGMQMEKAAAAHLELSKQMNSVHRFNRQVSAVDPLRPYMDVIVSMLDRIQDFDAQDTEVDDDDYKLDINTRQGLGVLRQRLRKGIEGYQREREGYLSIVHEYMHLHESLQNANRHGLPFIYADGTRASLVSSRFTWWWRCRIKPLGQRALAIMTAILSMMIVLAEVSIAEYLPNLSAFSRVLQAVKSNEVAVVIITFLTLLYVMSCMYYTLIRLGRFSFYLLVPKHTAPFSLASNALLLCRFVCPLCFNFMTAVVLPIKDDEDISVEQTQFWDRIGERISDTKLLGKYFTTYIPILTLPYVLLIAFNGINRVMSVLDPKLKHTFKDDWVLDMDSSYAVNGRQVMNLEVEYRQKGWEPGLTIIEGQRLAAVQTTVPTVLSKRPVIPGLFRNPTAGNQDNTAPARRSPRPNIPGAYASYDAPDTSPFIRRVNAGHASEHEHDGLRPATPRRSPPDIPNVPISSTTSNAPSGDNATQTLFHHLRRFFKNT